MEGIHNAPADQPDLYRGISSDKDGVRWSHEKVGTEVDLLPTSFSRSAHIAVSFAMSAHPTIIHVLSGSKGLVTPQKRYKERETISGGRYRVVGRSTVWSKGDLRTYNVISLRQVGTVKL